MCRSYKLSSKNKERVREEVRKKEDRGEVSDLKVNKIAVCRNIV
jgi:hypothetical protein